jgi:large conductance mechanosensitive channel protein
MFQGFKQFMLRGNVLDLAVAVVMGAAFGAVVTALVKDLITPLIAAIIGKPDFSAIEFTVNGSKFLIGDFINAVVSFLLIGAAVYFFILGGRVRCRLAPPHAREKLVDWQNKEMPGMSQRCTDRSTPLRVLHVPDRRTHVALSSPCLLNGLVVGWQFAPVDRRRRRYFQGVDQSLLKAIHIHAGPFVHIESRDHRHGFTVAPAKPC